MIAAPASRLISGAHVLLYSTLGIVFRADMLAVLATNSCVFRVELVALLPHYEMQLKAHEALVLMKF